jgi:hypothetical protein
MMMALIMEINTMLSAYCSYIVKFRNLEAFVMRLMEIYSSIGRMIPNTGTIYHPEYYYVEVEVIGGTESTVHIINDYVAKLISLD